MLNHSQVTANLLDIAQRAARRAGALLLDSARQANIVDKESHHDIKLQIDKSSENLIIETLQDNSDFPVLSEEAGWVGRHSQGPYWIVDPLDGTINYSKGIPFFGVSIALWEDRNPRCGVVYDPHRHEMFSGIPGQGAWLNQVPISVSHVSVKKEALLMTGFPAKADLSRDALQRLMENIQAYRKVRWIGSAALSLSYVACGRAEAYMEKSIMLWDIAGAAAVVMGAGGTVQFSRTGYQEHCLDVFASNGKLIEESL